MPEANNMNSDQSDLSSYCLQYRPPKCDQSTKQKREQKAFVENSGKKINLISICSVVIIVMLSLTFGMLGNFS